MRALEDVQAGVLTCEAAQWKRTISQLAVYKGKINKTMKKDHLTVIGGTKIQEDGVVGFCRQETPWFSLTLVIGHTLMHRGGERGRDEA